MLLGQMIQSDDRDGRPYHDFGLPVLSIRSKKIANIEA